jgi:hypothetical protein
MNLDLSYKMIDYSTHSDLKRNMLFQIYTILQKDANWNDSFLDFKKNYTKRNFKNTKLFLVFNNKEVIGFLEGWVFNKDCFFCKSFYISQDYKDKKIGTKLKLRVFLKLKSLGFKKYSEGMVVSSLSDKISENILKRKRVSLDKSRKVSFKKYPFKEDKKSKSIMFYKRKK